MADEHLNGEPQRCALPGCHEIIVQPADGGAPRKYCSAAHRVSGRKLRQAERMADITATEAASSPDGVDLEFRSAAADRFAARTAARVAARRVGGTTRIVAERTSRQARAIARRAGAGAGQPQHRRSMTATLGRRAVAVLGAASILGGTVQVVQSLQVAPTPDGASGSQPSTDPAIARVSVERELTQVTGELDKVTKALAWWNQQSLPGSKPGQVTALEQRFDVLSKQLNTLLAMQAAQNQLGPITAQLAAADSQLADIGRSLQAPPTSGSATAEQASQGLRAQQQMLSERRNALAMQLDTTRKAATAPLPAVPTDTDRVVGDVMAMPVQPPPQEPGTQRREPLSAITNRSGGSEDRDVVTVGAPPRSDPATLLPLTDGASASAGGDSSGGGRGDGGRGGEVTRQVGNVAQVDELPPAGPGGSETPHPAEVAAAHQAAMQAWHTSMQTQPGQPNHGAQPSQISPRPGQTPPGKVETAPPKGETAPPKGQTAPPKGQIAPPKGETAPPEAESRPQPVKQDDSHPTHQSEHQSDEGSSHSSAASDDDGPPGVSQFQAKLDEAKRDGYHGSDDESSSEASGSRPSWTEFSGGDDDAGSGSGGSDSESSSSGSSSDWSSAFSRAS